MELIMLLVAAIVILPALALAASTWLDLARANDDLNACLGVAGPRRSGRPQPFS